jgi:Ca2+-binding RTX toxin-like protein
MDAPDAADDYLHGGDGDDYLWAHGGADTLKGGHGDDRLVSVSDAGEPEIAQDPTYPQHHPDQPLLTANDTLTGGLGSDTFLFQFNMSAPRAIAEKHADANGVNDWKGVMPENAKPHDHWVESIGMDTITDFSRAEYDLIMLTGHTVDCTIEHVDEDGDGVFDFSLIHVFSNQKDYMVEERGMDPVVAETALFAHHLDSLGTIKVYGDLLTDDDVSTDWAANYGSYETVDDLPI